MMTKILRVADKLFKPNIADVGSDAAKLQDIRKRLGLRNREIRVAERRGRLERRAEAALASGTR